MVISFVPYIIAQKYFGAIFGDIFLPKTSVFAGLTK